MAELNEEPIIGEIDADGYRIGFIDQDGLAWESVRERDLSLTAGRHRDAFIAWVRGGRPGAEPDPVLAAVAVCIDPAHIAAAAAAAQDAVDGPLLPGFLSLRGRIDADQLRQDAVSIRLAPIFALWAEEER